MSTQPKQFIRQAAWFAVCAFIGAVPSLRAQVPGIGALSPRLDRQFFFPVMLNPGETQTYNLWGELRSARSTQGQTLLVLVSGRDYDHRYWDFPDGPSFVDAAVKAGYAVLNLDKLGVGYSSRPPGSTLGIPQEAFTFHQVIGSVRNGVLNEFGFGKVVIVGHSSGSALSVTEATTYRDVAGVVLTGISHTAGSRLLDIIPATIPVGQDPALSTQGYPSDYLTLRSDAIASLFYAPPTTDPAVLATNLSIKVADVLAEENAVQFFVVDPQPAPGINVPLLTVFGESDVLLGDTGTAQRLQSEPSFYPNSPSVTVIPIPKTGHDLALSTTFPITDAVIFTWLKRYIGSR